MSVEWNERDVQVRLWLENRSGARVIAPNYTPRDWFECDLWLVTRAGYAYEYEIKRTVADFKADQQKQMSLGYRHLAPYESLGVKSKHEMMAEGSARGPSRFWFVLPRGLGVEIPVWAGHIEAWMQNGIFRHNELKPAPRLHKEKVEEPEVSLAQERLAWRYWGMVHDHNRTMADKRYEMWEATEKTSTPADPTGASA